MYTNPKRMVLISLALGLGPAVTVLIAGLIAGFLGCELDEAGANSCMVAGANIGPFLSLLAMTVILLFVTIPTMIASLLGAMVWALWIWFQQRRNRAGKD